MKSIVITGSTRGIGLGLTKSFLELGCVVTISGRSPESIALAINELKNKFPAQHVLGITCDVRDFNQVQALWNASREQTGQIDIWINNAGTTNPPMNIWQSSPEVVRSVIETNILGTTYGSMVAVQGMLEQGTGCVYNTEGMGSDGRKLAGLAFYGMSKYGLRYFNESLVAETRGTPVLVGSLRPGMVVTDLITRQFDLSSAEWQRAKRVFNLLAERVEIVAPKLAKLILANQKHGAIIRYHGRGQLMLQVLSAMLTKRDLFR